MAGFVHSYGLQPTRSVIVPKPNNGYSIALGGTMVLQWSVFLMVPKLR